MRTIFIFIIVYLSVTIFIHFLISDSKKCETQKKGLNQSIYLDSMLLHSDQFDKTCIVLEGDVIESGDKIFDLVLVNSYTLRCGESTVRVFSNDNTPVRGSHILITGEFRQFFHGHYYTMLAVIETQRIYMGHHRLPEFQSLSPTLKRIKVNFHS